MSLANMLAEARANATEEEYESATEAAVALIVLGGFDANDSDRLGDEMGDTVQTLLITAILRQPEMVENWYRHSVLDLGGS